MGYSTFDTYMIQRFPSKVFTLEKAKQIFLQRMHIATEDAMCLATSL